MYSLRLDFVVNVETKERSYKRHSKSQPHERKVSKQVSKVTRNEHQIP